MGANKDNSLRQRHVLAFDAAGPFEVHVSSTTRSLIEDSGFVCEDRGGHSLKGLAAPRRVYAVVG